MTLNVYKTAEMADMKQSMFAMQERIDSLENNQNLIMASLTSTTSNGSFDDKLFFFCTQDTLATISKNIKAV